MEKDKQNIFNIYCDESRVENPESSKMVIGAVLVRRTEKERIVTFIRSLFEKHRFSHELKWIRTTSAFVSLYRELLDYFFTENDLQFRCIVVDKKKIKYELHHNDPELAFFKFYYFMLKAKLLDNKSYYIFLDRKPTRDKNRARALASFLTSYVLFNKKACAIEHLQAYDSGENVLIQMSDFLTGLMGHACNRGVEKGAKGEIIQYVANTLRKKDICRSTAIAEEKFNVFVWQPN